MPGGPGGCGSPDTRLTHLSPDRESGCPCFGARGDLYRDIAASAGNPRQVFLNYPLGNPAGRPHDPENQRAVLRAGLKLLEEADRPGIIVDLPTCGQRKVPPSASPGTGFVLVAYDNVRHTLGFNVTFSGLLTNVAAAHIHSPAPPTANAGVATTVPTLPGFPSGVTSGNYEQTLDLTLAASFNPAFITANGGTAADAEAALAASLAAGTAYFNIHTTGFPGGEIRGQFAAVPGALFVPTILRDSVR